MPSGFYKVLDTFHFIHNLSDRRVALTVPKNNEMIDMHVHFDELILFLRMLQYSFQK